MRLSVILCTHDSRPEHLRRTLAALRAQTLPRAEWELIVVDNASAVPLGAELVAWHPHGRVVREENLGLSLARERGIGEARSELLVFCDDDNLLMPAYLTLAARLFAERKKLGAAGGKSLPAYAVPLPAWLEPFADRLAVRDLGEEPQIASWGNPPSEARAYPPCSPVGAGMVLLREVGREFARMLETPPLIPDRVGRELSAGGDCALVLTALEMGWEVGYFPELELVHLIPAERMRLGYLARLNRAGTESWVRVLARHGIFPWRAISRRTIRLRQIRAFFAQRAWRGPAHYFRWAGACGIFAGQAQIARSKQCPESNAANCVTSK
jgi:glycosyltransferase involved in cell wall biosynthesis